MLVFRPVSDADLRSLGEGAALTGPAWSVTPDFRDAFGLGPADDEDAERPALYLAGLDGLQRHGRRLVVVAEVPARDVGHDYGSVEVGRIAFGDVRAIFADEPDAGPLVDAARAATAGLAIEDAWDDPAHEALLAGADLLWYGPEEWATLAD